MRMDIRRGLGGLSINRFEYRTECDNRRYRSCSENIALGSVIKVKVGKKIVPMKTITHRNRDIIEANANGKKYVCSWWDGGWDGEWTANKGKQ